MKFFDQYKEEMISYYKMKHNKLELDQTDMDKIESKFQELLKEKYKPVLLSVSNTTKQNPNEQSLKVDLVSTYDDCREKDCVFSLSHGVFKSGKSLFLEKWDNLKTQRDIAKKSMKEALKNNDIAKFHMYNGHQNVKKRNANGMYGACGERGFILYNVDVISNLTGTCFYVLTSTINQIEKILGSRIILRNEDEFLNYITYLMNKDISQIVNFNDNFNIIETIKNTIKENDIEYVFERYLKYTHENISQESKEYFKDLLKTIYKNDILRFALFKYNCDLNTFMDDTDFIYKMIEKDYDNYLSEKFDEHKFKEVCEDVHIILNCLVYEDKFQYDVQSLCDDYKRSTVMLSDTDSTFCVSSKLFNNIMISLKRLTKDRNEDLGNDLEYKVHAFKMIMYIGETMSDFFLKTISGPLYQNSKDNRWKLKSEFLYNKIILFMVKKTYFGSILSQEGIRLNPMKLDNKNTELVRSVYNYLTKDFMKELYDALVMQDQNTNVAQVAFNTIKKYHEIFDNEIKDPEKLSKLGRKSNYKLEKSYKNDPLSVYQYKAAVIYNALYPESKIPKGFKTRLFKVKDIPDPEFELMINKQDFLDKCGITDEEVLSALSRSRLFKADKVNLYKLMEVFSKKYIDYVTINAGFLEYKKMMLAHKREEVKKYFTKYLGITPELKRRFQEMFQNEKENKKLIDLLTLRPEINHIAIEFHKNVPEDIVPLIDTNQIKLSSIDERVERILSALRFKVYSKSDKSKTCMTNILHI